MFVIALTIISYWLGFGIIMALTLYLALQFAKLCESVVDAWSRRT